ncbi:hypothetical protein [Microbacterium sp. NPDC076911]|uniref:hypothetical protein n=1 Tax=Microbacterium sp. NPDC076911 TaxID=3154958 RepID=UPI00342FDF21
MTNISNPPTTSADVAQSLKEFGELSGALVALLAGRAVSNARMLVFDGNRRSEGKAALIDLLKAVTASSNDESSLVVSTN